MQPDFTATPPAPDANQMLLIQKKLKLESSIKNGVGWFFWIGGLSILNTIIFFFNGSITFTVGLGVTQIIDGFSYGLAQNAGANETLVRIIGLALDLAIAALFIAAGVLGIKRQRWAIIAGMALYALDTIIFVAFKEWLGVVFHVVALAGLWGGLNAINQLKKMEESSPLAFASLPAMPAAPAVAPMKPSNLARALVFVLLGLMIFSLLIVVIFVIGQ